MSNGLRPGFVGLACKSIIKLNMLELIKFSQGGKIDRCDTWNIASWLRGSHKQTVISINPNYEERKEKNVNHNWVISTVGGLWTVLWLCWYCCLTWLCNCMSWRVRLTSCVRSLRKTYLKEIRIYLLMNICFNESSCYSMRVVISKLL